jgi:hypothetical protein
MIAESAMCWVPDMIPDDDDKPFTFHDAVRRFTDGNDSPRAAARNPGRPPIRSIPSAPRAAVARRAQGELALDVLHVESGPHDHDQWHHANV